MARQRISTSPVLTVDLNVTGIAELPDLTRGAILRGMRRGMNRLRQLARRNAGGGVLQRRSGKLVSSMRAWAKRQGDDVLGYVGTQRFYGRLLEYGTKAHPIPKVGKKAKGPLPIGGRFYARVKHPGVTPRPWFRPAMEEGLPQVAGLVEEELIVALAREQLARG